MVQADDDFGASFDPKWWFLAGTSMATSLVAGCAAVLREIWKKTWQQDLSAALVKALLINGAIEVPVRYIPGEAGPSPNSSSGYGRVSLSNSIILPAQTDGGFLEGGPLE
jgi:hypothetical protein